jgi:chemotaxis protein methyltransferase CheR
MKTTTDNIVHLMNEKYLLDISMFSETFLHNTIGHRITSTDSVKPDIYYNKLAEDHGEALLLRDSLSNSYSTFFRNQLTFSILQQFVLPKILSEKEKNHDNEIRIWSAGCAAGQEPYSLAMLTADLLSKTDGSKRFRIFATDNDKQELALAARGIYEFDSIRNLPYKYIHDYFSKDGDTYTVRDSLKKQVEFSDYDLLDGFSSSPPASIYGDFDLVMCCNVLFYYKPEFQKLILEKFTRSICHGGFLVTGEAEIGIVNAAKGFRHYMSPATLFIKG